MNSDETIEFFQDGYNVPKEKKIKPPWDWTSDDAERIMDICLFRFERVGNAMR